VADTPVPDLELPRTAENVHAISLTQMRQWHLIRDASPVPFMGS